MKYTEEVFDIRSNTKLYPLAYFPAYLISKTGVIFNTMTMKDEYPVKYSKKETSYSGITKDYDFRLKGGYISKETAKKKQLI